METICDGPHAKTSVLCPFQRTGFEKSSEKQDAAARPTSKAEPLSTQVLGSALYTFPLFYSITPRPIQKEKKPFFYKMYSTVCKERTWYNENTRLL